MFGVTLFGIFLTPVFFYAITGLGESRLLASAVSRRTVSCCMGGGVGMAGGFLLGKLGVVMLPWSALVGAAAGVLAVLAVLEIQRRTRKAEKPTDETRIVVKYRGVLITRLSLR